MVVTVVFDGTVPEAIVDEVTVLGTAVPGTLVVATVTGLWAGTVGVVAIVAAIVGGAAGSVVATVEDGATEDDEATGAIVVSGGLLSRIWVLTSAAAEPAPSTPTSEMAVASFVFKMRVLRSRAATRVWRNTKDTTHSTVRLGAIPKCGDQRALSAAITERHRSGSLAYGA